MYKQIIIVRKDLSMSHGKMAAQVSHASMAFLTNMIQKNIKKNNNEKTGRSRTHDGKAQYYRHPDLDEFAKNCKR